MTPHFRPALLAAALMVVTPVLSSAPMPADSQDGRIKVADSTRHYRLRVPDHWAEGMPRTLVIALHGGGSNARGLERYSGLSEQAAQAGFLLAYPEGSARFGRLLTWNAGRCCGYAQKQQIDDVAFLRQLIDELSARYAIDARRVYLTGMSNGAMMAYRLAAEHPERIAAVAAVAGGLAIAPEAVRGPVAILHIHGTADSYVPYDGGLGKDTLSGVAHTSVAATLAPWLQVNGAMTRAQATPQPDIRDDGMTVTRYRYASARDPGAVTLYRIEGGGHTWPGRTAQQGLLGPASQDIEANDLIWAFFRAHPKPVIRPGDMTR